MVFINVLCSNFLSERMFIMWLLACQILLLVPQIMQCHPRVTGSSSSKKVVIVPFAKIEPLIHRVVVIPIVTTPAPKRFFATAAVMPAGFAVQSKTNQKSTPSKSMDDALDQLVDNLVEVSLPRSTSVGVTPSLPMKFNSSAEGHAAAAGAEAQLKVDVQEVVEEEPIQPMPRLRVIPLADTVKSPIASEESIEAPALRTKVLDNNSGEAKISVEKIVEENAPRRDNMAKLPEVVKALELKFPDFPHGLLRSFAQLHILKGKH